MKLRKMLAPVWVDYDGGSFNIKPLSGLEMSRFIESSSSGKIQFDVAAVVRAGLIGWRGVVDDDGNEMPFSVRAMDMLSLEAAMFLAGEIITRSTMTGEQEKN